MTRPRLPANQDDSPRRVVRPRVSEVDPLYAGSRGVFQSHSALVDPRRPGAIDQAARGSSRVDRTGPIRDCQTRRVLATRGVLGRAHAGRVGASHALTPRGDTSDTKYRHALVKTASARGHRVPEANRKRPARVSHRPEESAARQRRTTRAHSPGIERDRSASDPLTRRIRPGAADAEDASGPRPQGHRQSTRNVRRPRWRS